MGFLMFFAVLGGANAYIALRLWQWARCSRPALSPLWGAGLFVCLLGLLLLGFLRSRLPVGPEVKYALNAAGSVWMGVFVYLFLFLLLGDLCLGLARLFGLTAPRGRAWTAAAALALTGIVSVTGFLHAGKLTLTRYEVPSVTPMEGEVRIVLLSDLHLGAVCSEGRLPRIVERINGLEPDMVCIAGDFFDNDFAAIRHPDADAALLGSIRAPLGVWMCPGNHDAGADPDRMRAFLERCGVTLLTEELAVAGDRIAVAGRADPSPIGRGLGERARGDTAALLSSAPEGLPLIVLDHSPAAADEYGVGDLVLCGHTHKGQIFPGELFTHRLFPVDYGCRRRDEAAPWVIVSSGAGTWGMPMRVGTDSEIVLIRLWGENGDRAPRPET